MLPERAVAQMAQSVSIGWDLPADRRYLACAPISHAAGMLVTPVLLSGGTVVLMRAFDPASGCTWPPPSASRSGCSCRR